MTTELATYQAPAALPTLFTSMDDYMHLSQMLADSQFVPRDFRNKPADVLAAVLYGRSVGLDPMQALQSIGVINGRPSIYGDAALGLCRASGIPMTIKETIEGDGPTMEAVCKVTRGSEEFEARFSVEDAKKAALWGKSGPWSQYPRRMLAWRARGFVLRDAFPDVLKGLITREEAQDYPTHELKNVTPIREQLASPGEKCETPPSSALSGKYAVVDEDGQIIAANDRVSQLLPVLSEIVWTPKLARLNEVVVGEALAAADAAAKSSNSAKIASLYRQAKEVAEEVAYILVDNGTDDIGDDDNMDGQIEQPEMEAA